MSALAAQQAAFWRSVRTSSNEHVPEFFRDRGALSASARMEIYRTAYWCRQVDALRELFPTIVAHLGDGPFAREASTFIAAHPSRDWAIELLGAAFPPWLERSSRCLSQVASVDWQRWKSFVAVDEALLQPTALTPEAVAALRLRRTQHVGVIELDAEACALAVPALVWTPTMKTLVIWRMGFEVHQQLVSDAEGQALAACEQGVPFTEWCDRMQVEGADAPQLHATLSRWLACGWLASRSAS